MRAFVITFDSLIAVSFLFIAALLVATTTFQPYAPRGVYLKQLTLDVLTVMEKTGSFGIAIDGNSSAMRQVLRATPEPACIQVTISDDNGNELATLTKLDCGAFGRELQTAAMPFVHDGDLYMAKAQSWYKKVSS